MTNQAHLYVAGLPVVLGLTACTQPHLLVDITTSKPTAARDYANDITECKSLVSRVGDGGVGEVLLGTLAGAALGATAGHAVGGPDLVAFGAAHGAAAGVTKGAVRGAREQRHRTETAMDRCMTARGYTVLGKEQLLADQ